MSNVDKIKDIVTNPKKPKAATKLVNGNEEDIVIPETVNEETAATNEESEKNNELNEYAKAFADDKPPKKREKILKGIYLDEDVLEVYKGVSEEMPRGWGSQLVSDLLRKEFIRRGIKIDPQ